MEIVPIDPELIQQISSVRIFIPTDLRSSDNRKAVFKSVQQVQKRFGENKIPLLDPVEDMKINEKPFKEIIKKISTFEARLTSHPMHARPGDKFMQKFLRGKILTSNTGTSNFVKKVGN